MGNVKNKNIILDTETKKLQLLKGIRDNINVIFYIAKDELDAASNYESYITMSITKSILDSILDTILTKGVYKFPDSPVIGIDELNILRKYYIKSKN